MQAARVHARATERRVEKDKFVYHDPAIGPYKKVPFDEVRTWASAWLDWDEAATVALESPMPEYTPTASIVVPHPFNADAKMGFYEGMVFRKGVRGPIRKRAQGSYSLFQQRSAISRL